MQRRVLIVDDEAEVGLLLEAGLQQAGCETRTLTSPDAALALMDVEPFDLVVTDLQMPTMSGLELCERVLAAHPDVPVVLVTAHASLDSAIAAIRAGVYDFVTKPVKMQAFQLTVERALRHRELVGEVKRLREVVQPAAFPGVIGSSVALRAVLDLVSRVASTDSTVLITGESGTGKELVARALHDRSRRAAGPFIALNCAAVPEALLDSELFGHTKGAFTGATNARTGLLLKASGGTLLLDEIGEMAMPMQAKLLRALQERTLRPVGGDHEVPFDVRIIAATNRDLETAVEEGRFRDDLYYRIHVVRIELPPLRTRGNDILELAQHALVRLARAAGKSVRGISGPAAQKLLAYSWPGNVRELSNAIESAIAITRFEELAVDDLPASVREHQGAHVIVAGDDPEQLPTMEEVERRYVARVMDAVQGNKALAARVLGFDRKTLYRKLERYAR
jgi:two-component system response regulator AtoC